MNLIYKSYNLINKMFVIDQIECVCCNDVLFVESIDSESDSQDYNYSCDSYSYNYNDDDRLDHQFVKYKEMYLYNEEYYCMDCLICCEDCNKYIEKYNDTYDYCENCFKKALIKNTYNDITKIFPMEIVDMIMKL